MKNTRQIHTIAEWNECQQAIPAAGLILFKFSPVCPISRGVERHFDTWYAELPDSTEVLCVKVDVRGARELSQHIAKELKVSHESPQAIWITPEHSILWHDSHRLIQTDVLNTHLATIQQHT